MFVVLEALDCVGKTTLAKNLAEHFNGEMRNTPGDTLRDLREDILEALDDNQIANCLFYASSVFAEGERARELADRGNLVFMDRYWLSTIAYARARGVSVDLSSLEAIVPKPDLTVLLILDEEERQRRLKCGDATDADRETLDKDFREIVLSEMRNPKLTPALRPIEIDITDADENEVIQKILKVLPCPNNWPSREALNQEQG